MAAVSNSHKRFGRCRLRGSGQRSSCLSSAEDKAGAGRCAQQQPESDPGDVHVDVTLTGITVLKAPSGGSQHDLFRSLSFA